MVSWGRGQETPSEGKLQDQTPMPIPPSSPILPLLCLCIAHNATCADPTINGDYAEQFVKGMQGDNPTYLKVSACLKHYAGTPPYAVLPYRPPTATYSLQ